MRTAILLIVLAMVGSASFAEAQSRWTNDRYNEASSDRWAQPPGNRWFSLTGNVSTRRPRNLINVNSQSIDRIGIRANSGFILVRRISVEYANRNVVDYELNARLQPGETRTINTRGRRIYRMEVIVDPRWRGSYEIMAAPGWRRPGPPIG